MGRYVPNPAGQAKFREAVVVAVNAGVTRAARELATFAKNGMGTGGRFRASPPGSPPNTQRHTLRKSITHTQARNFRASAGTNIVYGIVHERGGVIRASRSKYLTIPVNIPAQRLLEQRGTVRGLDLTFIPGRGGSSPMLVGKDPRRVTWHKGGKRFSVSDLPAFVLKKQVVIPRRPWLRPALENHKQAIAKACVDEAARSFAHNGFGRMQLRGMIP